jgi:hypothetical protein
MWIGVVSARFHAGASCVRDCPSLEALAYVRSTTANDRPRTTTRTQRPVGSAPIEGCERGSNVCFVSRASRYVTTGALVGIGAVHVAWGLGSSFPFRTHVQLADAVVGSDVVPSPAACLTVAAALFVAGGLAADVPVMPRRLRRIGRHWVAGVLAIRGMVGLCGRTDLLSAGSASTRFRSLDRTVYSPICLALAVGAATAVREQR